MPASKNPTTSARAPSATLDSVTSYEQAFAELEQIVATMESGQMTLEESLAAYQRGNVLLEFCQQSLASVEQQVRILNERQQLSSYNPHTE